MMVCAGIMFLMFLGYTSLGAKITTVGHEINELKQQIAEVENTNDRLMLEVEELSSPEAVSYTHLDVYKRQVLYIAICKFY